MTSTAELWQRVDALRWYHTIDLGHGVVTRGADNTPLRLARLDGTASFPSKPSVAAPRALSRAVVIQ